MTLDGVVEEVLLAVLQSKRRRLVSKVFAFINVQLCVFCLLTSGNRPLCLVSLRMSL